MSDREAQWIAEQVVQIVAELPDRTSPDDWPEAMLVTADELRDIVSDAVLAAPAWDRPPEALDAKVVRGWMTAAYVRWKSLTNPEKAEYSGQFDNFLAPWIASCFAGRAEQGRGRPADEELLEVARDMLSSFSFPGHPGEACMQSGWIRLSMIRGWREAVERAALRVRAPQEPSEQDASKVRFEIVRAIWDAWTNRGFKGSGPGEAVGEIADACMKVMSVSASRAAAPASARPPQETPDADG